MRQQWLSPSPHPPRILAVSALQMKPSPHLRPSGIPNSFSSGHGKRSMFGVRIELAGESGLIECIPNGVWDVDLDVGVKVGSLSVSSMGFGTWTWTWTWAWGNQLLWGYDQAIDSELQRIFNLVIDNEINLFNTADSYGTGRLIGQSEKLLGKFIREFPGQKQVRDNIVIATKFAAYPWRLTPGQFVNACKSSLERLQIEQIGIGQLHWSTANYAPPQELALWNGLVAMYEKGLVSSSWGEQLWTEAAGEDT